MEITVQECFEAEEALRTIQEIGDIPAFRLRNGVNRQKGKLKETMSFLNQEKDDLIKKYHTQEKNDVWKLIPGMSEEFNKALNEFKGRKIDIDVYKLFLSDFKDVKLVLKDPEGKIEKINLPPINMDRLFFCIEDDLEEKKAPEVPGPAKAN